MALWKRSGAAGVLVEGLRSCEFWKRDLSLDLEDEAWVWDDDRGKC